MNHSIPRRWSKVVTTRFLVFPLTTLRPFMTAVLESHGANTRRSKFCNFFDNS
jgi:hypothetical protein